MARPTKLTPELTRDITSYISEGNPPTIAATLVGISPSTYFNWMSKGSQKTPRFMEFSELIKRATAQSIANRVAHISRAAEGGHWRAAAWLLEKMEPDLFGPNQTRSLQKELQKVKDPQEISIQKLEDSVAQILEIRRKQSEKLAVKSSDSRQIEEFGGK